MGQYGLSDEVYKTVERIVENDILSNQTMLVEALLYVDFKGFSIDDIENMYIDNSDEIKELEDEKEELEDENLDLESEIEELEDEIKSLNGETHEENEDENEVEFEARIQSKINRNCDDIYKLEKTLKQNEKRIEEIEDEIKELEDQQEEPQEAYSWYLVSNWLADKLREHNEIILSNDYDTWWGRGCCGQSITLDSVIHEIAKEICHE